MNGTKLLALPGFTSVTAAILKSLTYNKNSEHDGAVFRNIQGENVSTKVNAMTPRDLSLVLKDAPPGEWIALSLDKTRVVGHGETIDKAVKAAQDAGEDQHILIKMPMPNVGIAASIT